MEESTKKISLRVPENLIQKLDSLVDHGFYRNRSEAILEAIRLLLKKYNLLEVKE